jgi:acyl-CoA synthetase (AMP-forming)/AMP-acid ligase II
VPPLWLQLVEADWSEAARRGLRLFANTGGAMQAPLLARLRALFPTAEPFLMYGLTEAFRSTYLPPPDADRRPDSIGKAIPNAEILVLREDGSECEPGEIGELVHRGAHVALGYWNDPKRSAERFRPFPQPAAGLAGEAAVWSGDLVVRDEEGFLFFVGRRDEMIKSSGYRISPTEVESVLFQYPQIAEAAVFGAPDEALGQRIVALVVSRDGPLDERGLAAHCGRSLASYMMPEIVRFPELPRLSNGKLDRAGLAALYHAHVQETGVA